MNYKILRLLKFQIVFLIVFLFQFACFCYEHPQTITITKEDIINASPKSPYDVNFSPKELKYIEIMEKRHFNKTFEEYNDEIRLKNLEYELLGRSWKYTPKEKRIETLKIASSNRMLEGMALPSSISSQKISKRLRNDSIQMRKKDNVGLIDGFLRLLSPEKYELYRKYSDLKFEQYDY